MNNHIIAKGIDILDRFYPSVNTAFILSLHWGDPAKSIRIVILHDNFDYHTFEMFQYETIVVEVLIFPKSFLTIGDRHIDFARQHQLLDIVSEGTLLKDTYNHGERLQLLFGAIGGHFFSPQNTASYFSSLFDFSRAVHRLEACTAPLQAFLIKTDICHMLHAISQKYGFLIDVSVMRDTFNDDIKFLECAQKIQKEIGADITFLSENETFNFSGENKISILISNQFSLDELITVFLIHLLAKLKKVTSKIMFSFKLHDSENVLLTVWTDATIISRDIIPALNLIFANNLELYKKLSPKYPFAGRQTFVMGLITEENKVKRLQILVTEHLLELSFNEKTSLTEGFRVSYGIYMILEILLMLDTSKDDAMKNTSLLFESWLPAAYATGVTNFNDLEIQSHVVLNDFENLYLSQNEALQVNYGEIISEWKPVDESITGLTETVRSFFEAHHMPDSLLEKLSQSRSCDKKYILLENIIFETLSLLMIGNFHKAYIVYTINRMLHEI